MGLSERVLNWCTEQQGSTRAVGLLRILLAAIILIRYGSEVAFFAADDVAHALLAGYFFALTTLMLVGAWTRLIVPLVALILAIMYFVFFPTGSAGTITTPIF